MSLAGPTLYMVFSYPIHRWQSLGIDGAESRVVGPQSVSISNYGSFGTACRTSDADRKSNTFLLRRHIQGRKLGAVQILGVHLP